MNLNSVDQFWSEWQRATRIAFDNETARLRTEGFSLFLACISTCCAVGALVRIFL